MANLSSLSQFHCQTCMHTFRSEYQSKTSNQKTIDFQAKRPAPETENTLDKIKTIKAKHYGASERTDMIFNMNEREKQYYLSKKAEHRSFDFGQYYTQIQQGSFKSTIVPVIQTRNRGSNGDILPTRTQIQ